MGTKRLLISGGFMKETIGTRYPCRLYSLSKTPIFLFSLPDIIREQTVGLDELVTKSDGATRDDPIQKSQKACYLRSWYVMSRRTVWSRCKM